MNLWIVLITLFTTTSPAADQYAGAQSSDADPIRYRGIEQLLAKFDAEADPVSD